MPILQEKYTYFWVKIYLFLVENIHTFLRCFILLVIFVYTIL